MSKYAAVQKSDDDNLDAQISSIVSEKPQPNNIPAKSGGAIAVDAPLGADEVTAANDNAPLPSDASTPAPQQETNSGSSGSPVKAPSVKKARKVVKRPASAESPAVSAHQLADRSNVGSAKEGDSAPTSRPSSANIRLPPLQQ